MITSLALATITMLASTQPATAPASITVMTFNVRYGAAPDGDNAWQKRRELLFWTVERSDPDLLGAQEALMFQVDELRQRFPAYDAIAIGREDGKRKGESSAVFYRKDRFELVDSGHFWLSETPEAPGSVSWDSALTRMATWVKLRDRNNRLELIFLNAHYDHVGEKARLESSKLIRARLKQLSGGAIRFIMTADMNAHDDSPEFLALLGDDLIDAYRSVHPEKQPDEASFHAFKGTTRGSRIDYVLMSPQWRCTDATIDHFNDGGRYPSDHFPVVCKLLMQ